jgi:hypothetical protein
MMPLVATAPDAAAMASTAHPGRRVRDDSGYPTAPKPTAKAAMAGRLKKGDGARVRFRRRCSTPCSIANTANMSPPMNAMTEIMESAFTDGVAWLEGPKPYQRSIRTPDIF